MGEHLAFNTAISFTANTNWQSYAGESTMSNLSQMLALTIHNFMSAATGIALAFALFRGFGRAQAKTVGNFWADITRITLYLLLPICLVYTLVLIAQGVPQTLAGSVSVQTLEGARQTLALGPVASQEAIKMLGTNGGGFFNANSAHPFENPTALTNLLQMLSIFLIGTGLTWTFGKAVGNPRQGWAILAAMLILFLAGTTVAYWAEAAGNPILHQLGVAGGNMEGKRSASASPGRRCSPPSPPPPRAARSMRCTTASPRSAVSSAVQHAVGRGRDRRRGRRHLRLPALRDPGGLRRRADGRSHARICRQEDRIARGEAGGAGDRGAAARHPGDDRARLRPARGLAGPLNKGPHGFSEILYAFTSAVANNGSAFAGLTASTPFYDGLLGVAMWIGRFFVIVPMLAIAGSLAAKRQVPESAGSFPTTGGLWVGLLVGIILILGGLTFLPSLALGPIADHLAMLGGHTF